MRRNLPPPPEARIPPPDRTGPAWEQFCNDNPLHQAVCGRASAATTEARINEIIHWFHKGAAYVTVIGRGKALWGLRKARMEQLIALADKQMKATMSTDRHEYISRMITKLDGAIEGAMEDRQYSAAAGLISIIGRWLALDPGAARGGK